MENQFILDYLERHIISTALSPRFVVMPLISSDLSTNTACTASQDAPNGLELLHLPASVLGLIVANSYIVVPLWKCGNRLLHSKLVEGTQDVSLVDKMRHSTSRWPKLLSHLRNLRKLHIERPFSYLIYDHDAMAREVQSLSPLLEYLTIRCKDVLTAFVGPSIPPTLRHYPHGTSSFWSIRDRFPSLRSFDIGPSAVGFTWSDWPAFPDSITELSCCGKPLPLSRNSLSITPSSFPPHIANWKLILSTWNPSEAHLLPASTVSLSFGSLESSTSSPSLQHWTAPLERLTHLHTLSITRHCINVDSLRLLPPTITALTLNVLEENSFLIAASEGTLKSSWPDALKSLSFQGSSMLNQLCYHLPRHLETLGWDVEETAGFDLSVLPRSLTSMRLIPLHYSLVPYAIPPMLTQLELIQAPQQHAGPPSDAPSHPAHDANSTHSGSHVSSIPLFNLAWLTRLRLKDWSWHDFAKLPRTLTSLSIVIITGYSSSMDPAEDWFDSLPRGLVNFELIKSVETPLPVLSSNSFHHLTSLNSLWIRSTSLYFNANILKNLPRKMEAIEIGLDSMTEELTQYLPVTYVSSSYRLNQHGWSELKEHWPLHANAPWCLSLNGMGGEWDARIAAAWKLQQQYPDPRILN